MAPDADELLDLLGAELNRQILVLTSQEARSADAVAERCDASLPTVYRHVDDLAATGLLTEQTQYDAEGNHYKTYAAALSELSVRLEDGKLSVGFQTSSRRRDSDPVPDDAASPGTGPDDDVSRTDTVQ